MESGIFNAPPLSIIDLRPYDVFMGMLLAFALNFILAKISVYTNKSKSLNASPNLPLCMVLLGTTVSLIMAVIGNSLARAFGAIGALSLIRFRTAVKEPLDLAKLFMTISIGMTTGSGHFKIACGATVIYGIFLILADFLPLKQQKNQMCLLKISYKPEKDKRDKITALLNSIVFQSDILSEEASDTGDLSLMIVEASCTDTSALSENFSKFKEISSEITVSVINN